MGIEVSKAVWNGFPCGSSKLLAMLVLAEMADNDNWVCWPSMATIGQRMRVSEGQARRVVHLLRDEGWIAVIANHKGGGGGKSCRFQINREALTDGANAIAASNDIPSGVQTPSIHAQEGLHTCTGWVASMHETPSADASRIISEPSLKQSSVNRHSDASKDWAPKKEPDDPLLEYDLEKTYEF